MHRGLSYLLLYLLKGNCLGWTTLSDPVVCLMFFDPIVHIVLHVLDGVHDILAGIRSALLARMLVAICRLLGSILHVAPGFLGDALYLIGDTLVSHALISNRFSNLL